MLKWKVSLSSIKKRWKKLDKFWRKCSWIFLKIFETLKHENSRGGKSTVYEILKKYENMGCSSKILKSLFWLVNWIFGGDDVLKIFSKWSNKLIKRGVSSRPKYTLKISNGKNFKNSKIRIFFEFLKIRLGQTFYLFLIAMFTVKNKA